MTGNQVVSTMFNINSFVHMARFVPFQDQDEDPGMGIHYVMFFTQAMMERIWIGRIFQYNHHIRNLTDVYSIT